MSGKSKVVEAFNAIDDLTKAVKKSSITTVKSVLKEQFMDVAKGLKEMEDDEADDVTINPADGENQELGMDGGEPSNEPVVGDEGDDLAEPAMGDENPELGNNVDDLAEPVMGDETSELGDDSEELIDLTNASDDEIINTISLGGAVDEIEVVKTADGISLNIKGANLAGNTNTGDELGEPAMGDENSEMIGDEGDDLGKPSLGSNETGETEMSSIDNNSEMGDENGEEDEDENKMFEINISTGDVSKEEHDKVKSDLKEMRIKYNKTLLENKKLKDNNATLAAKVSQFALIAEGYENTVNKLTEGIHQAKLYLATSNAINDLLREHTLTKDEKVHILNEFDKVSSEGEVEALYESFDNKFKNTSKEDLLENKIIGTTGGSSSSSSSNLVKNGDRSNDRILRLMQTTSRSKK